MRTPTAKQYALLLPLGSGDAGMSCRQRAHEPLFRHGWVTGRYDHRTRLWHFVRLTPEGFHALARAVERHGLPGPPYPARKEQP